MRILLLTQWFQPESFFKGLPFAKALKDKGHDVEVLTGFPNYPGGKVYPGYRIRFYQQEVMAGIKVHRLPLYPSHDQSALRRIVNYLSFASSALLMAPWLVRKPDVIYVYNLVTLGFPAFLLRLLYGCKVIIDVQDLWPESIAGSGLLSNKYFLRVLNGFCNWVYRKADQLVVLSPGFKHHLMTRNIPEHSIQIIYNWCDEAGLKKVTDQPQGKISRKFTVLYAGAMGVVQGLDTLLECAGQMREKRPDVEFIFIGDGADRKRLEQRVSDMKLSNVVFLPRRPIEAMGEVYDMADALIVHLKDHPLFRITIPSKTQGYLYVGKPLIMAVRGDAASLVENAGAGVVCEPDNPLSIMAAIEKLYDAGPAIRKEMGESGHRYYVRHLSFDKGVNNFENVMTKLVKSEKKKAQQ